MTIGEMLAAELVQEGKATRKVLERLPDDKFEWQPHEKSMKLGALVSHVVNNLGWTGATIGSDGIDFETMDFTPQEFHNSADAVAGFDKALNEAAEMLASASDEDLMAMWTARAGEKVYFSQPKAAVIRGFVMNPAFTIVPSSRCTSGSTIFRFRRSTARAPTNRICSGRGQYSDL